MEKPQTTWKYFEIRAIIFIFALSLMGLVNTQIAYANTPNIDIAQFAIPSSPPEQGGSVTYLIEITNDGSRTINLASLQHNVYGDLNGKGTCALPQSIGSGNYYDCKITDTIANNTPIKVITHTMTATAVDSLDNSQTATETNTQVYTIQDARSEILTTLKPAQAFYNEPGGTLTFDITVENKSTVDNVDIEELTMLAGSQTINVSTSVPGCGLPKTLAAGGSFTCTIGHVMIGQPGDQRTYTVTAKGKDDDNLLVESTDSEVIKLADVQSSVQVIKSANPMQQSEPGGIVSYDIEVHNRSATDVITVTHLIDTVHGSLDNVGNCQLPQRLEVNTTPKSFTCTYTSTFSGNPGDTESSMITATAIDDDSQTITDTDTIETEITDVPSGIFMTKSVQPNSLPEPGGTVTYTVRIRNTSATDIVTIDTLTDTHYGDISLLQTTCPLTKTLGLGDRYQCTFTVNITDKNAGFVENSLTTASGTDDDNGPVNYQNDAPVTIYDIPADIELTYDVTPGSIQEGASNVTFTVTISNTSAADQLDITTLTDDLYGNLHGVGDCSIPQTLAIGEGYRCSFVKTITGNAGELKSHKVTATGIDDDNIAITDNYTTVVNILDTPPTISVINNVTPSSLPEPGGNIAYIVKISNTSTVDPVDVMTLTDSIHGNLHGQGNCSIPQRLEIGQSYTCSFNTTIAGTAGDQETYTVEAYGIDDDGSWGDDDEDDTVTISNVPAEILVINTITPGSVPEPGGIINYFVEIRNLSSVDAVTITTLTDSIYGNLDGQGNCATSQTLAVGQVYTCNFTKMFTGIVGHQQTHTLTAQGVDNDLVAVSDDDNAAVSITDVPSKIVVTNNITPGSVPEPGGTVTYQVVVRNTSSVDTVDIVTLTDSIYGNLQGQGSCVTPQTLAVGQQYTCSFTRPVTGNAGHQEVHKVIAQGMDDDNKPVSDDDDETVTVTDVASSIAVLKTASTPNINELGANVIFTVRINNTSPADDVTLEKVDDSVHGDITTTCLPNGPQVMAPGAAIACTYTRFVGGNAGHVENGTATASGTDDDGQSVSHQDDAPVTIGNIASAIDVTKTANKESVTELGGDVEFVVTVKNVSPVDSVTINELNDSVYGDIRSFCSPPFSTPMAPGATVTCTFTKPVTGNAGDHQTGTVVAKGIDDDGESVEDNDSTIVKITNLPASIEVVKTASTPSVDEAGENITFTVAIKNTSQTDGVNITGINDPDQGNLSALCTPSPSQTLALGGTITCTFTKFVVGNAGAVHNTTATVVGISDDGDSVQGSDDAPVTVTDLPSSMEVVKTASSASVEEDGADVTFTVTIENTSPVDPVNITSISDPDQNNIGSLCSPAISQSLAPGATITCTFTKFVIGDPDDVHNTAVTVIGQDDDGSGVSGNDDAPVTIIDVPSSIEVVKTASSSSINEDGADVVFTVVVKNTSGVDTVQLNTLQDVAYGDISPFCVPALSVPLTLGAATTCTFTEFVGGDPGDVVNSIVSAIGTDDDDNEVQDNDDAPVQITDTPTFIEVTKSADQTSVPEPSTPVRFTVAVENTSPVDDVTIDNVMDSVYGDISASCAPSLVGQTLAAGQSAICSFTEFISGPVDSSHSSIATVSGTGDDGTPVTDSDDTTVTIYDLPSTIDVTKSADLTNVDEAGSDVTFTIEVENTSTVDHVQIDSVIDAMYGDVSNTCQPSMPIILTPGQMITCSFTEFITGNPGDVIGSPATASGTDDDGNDISGADDVAVTISDLPAQIDVTKTAMPDMVDEIGKDVLFTIIVENVSEVDHVTIEQVYDSIYGDISDTCGAGPGLASLPITLAPGETVVCLLTEFISGNGDGLHENIATATGTDDDGNAVRGIDDAQVEIVDLPSSIQISKSVNRDDVIEPGEDVIFTTIVQNTSPADNVTITEMIDSVHGDISAYCVPALPTILGPGENLACTFTEFIGGIAGDFLVSSVNTFGTDDDGNSVGGEDEVTIKVISSEEASTASLLEPGVESTTAPIVTPRPFVTSRPVSDNVTPTTTATLTPVGPTEEPAEVPTEGPTVAPPIDDPTIVGPVPESTPKPTENPVSESTIVSPADDEPTVVPSTPSPPTENPTEETTDDPAEESTVVTPATESTPESTPGSTAGPISNVVEEATVVASTPESTIVAPIPEQPSELPFEQPAESTPEPNVTPVEDSTVVAPTSESTSDSAPEPNANPAEESTAVAPTSESTSELTSEPTPEPNADPVEEPTVAAPTSESNSEPSSESNSESNSESTPEPNAAPVEESTVELTPELTDEPTPDATETPIIIFEVGVPITATPPPTAVVPKVDLAVTIEIAQDQGRSSETTYVIYTIRYTNSGPDVALNVQLIDTLPEGVVYDSNTVPLESMEIPYLTWNLGTLQPNESGEIDLTLRITEDIIGEEFVNKVNISCDCIDADMTDNEDSVSHMVDIPKTSNETDPSAITLMSFQADPVNVVGGKAIEVRWEIGESFNTNGFDLHRGTTMDPAAAVKLTPNMVSVDSDGGVYRFTDETAQPDVTYIYWLFENEYSGDQNIYGPLRESISSDANVVYLPVVMK